MLLFRQLVDWVCSRDVPVEFVFDSYFTNATVLNHVHPQHDRYGGERQWYFTTSVRLPGVSHRVRTMIQEDNRRDHSPLKIFVTNRPRWEARRILSVYRQRWSGSETCHRDGKQYLGMGDGQLQQGRGQTRQMYTNGSHAIHSTIRVRVG